MSTTASKREQVQKIVLARFEAMYGDDVEDPLGTNPNDFDVDPGPFYEMLSAEFGVPFDDASSSFGGFGGGTLTQTIDFIAERWDGKLDR